MSKPRGGPRRSFRRRVIAGTERMVLGAGMALLVALVERQLKKSARKRETATKTTEPSPTAPPGR